MDTYRPKYLGKPNRNQPIDDLDAFPASAGVDRVTMTSDEVTAHCPVTDQPDFYTIIIEYVPDKLCIESKSLKLYLEHFRNERIFCEQLPVVIRDKVIEKIAPKVCKVTVIQKARGGITIKAESSYVR